MKTNVHPLTVLKQLVTTLLLIVLFPAWLHAQTIVLGADNDLFKFAPAFKVNTEINPPIEIGISPTSSLNVVWSLTNLPAGAVTVTEGGVVVSFTLHGIKVELPENAATAGGTPGTATAKISGTPDQAVGSIIFRIEVAANSGGGPAATRDFEISIDRDPVDLAIILDRSGSMGGDITGTFPLPAGKKSRWDFLKSGIDIMASQLQTSAKPADRLGVRMFASFPNVILPEPPFNAASLIALSEVQGLRAKLDLTAPGSGTALGDGILAGRDLLVADNQPHTKAMIVFSDGEQNEGDMVDAANPTQTLSGQKLQGGKNIQIHTICLGSTTANKALMNDIAIKNGGAPLLLESEDDADAQAFQLAFITQLQKIFGIQSGAKMAGAFAAGAAQAAPQSFEVNKGIDALTVTLVAPSQNAPFFKTITRNGVDMKDQVNIASGAGFVSFSIKPDAQAVALKRTAAAAAAVKGIKASATGLDGKWTIVPAITTPDTAAVPFTMLVSIDDRNVSPAFSLGAQEFKVNDVLHPNVKLDVLGKPVKNAQVTVTIVKPGDDVDDLIAKSEAKSAAKEEARAIVHAGDTISPALAKLTALLKDKNFRNKIKRKQQTIKLFFNPFDNTYKGSFNGLNVTGAYQAIFNITATHPQLGKIQRQHEESFFVRFPDIDTLASRPKAGKDLLGNVILTFVPRATNGKFLGSGWKNEIKLAGSDLTVKKITDTGIGIYFITLSPQPQQPFTLSMFGQQIFQGTLADLGLK